jgi:hypothetical protein
LIDKWLQLQSAPPRILHCARGLRSTGNALGGMAKVKKLLDRRRIASSTSAVQKFFASIAINIFISTIAKITSWAKARAATKKGNSLRQGRVDRNLRLTSVAERAPDILRPGHAGPEFARMSKRRPTSDQERTCLWRLNQPQRNYA